VNGAVFSAKSCKNLQKTCKNLHFSAFLVQKAAFFRAKTVAFLPALAR
jgi:hypothetical protein